MRRRRQSIPNGVTATRRPSLTTRFSRTLSGPRTKPSRRWSTLNLSRPQQEPSRPSTIFGFFETTFSYLASATALAVFFIGCQSERLCTCAAGPNVTQSLHGSFCLFQLAVNDFSRATDTNWESHRVAIEWSNSEGRRQAANRIQKT